MRQPIQSLEYKGLSMSYSKYFDAKHKIELLRKLSARNAAPEEFTLLLENLFFHRMEIKAFDITDQFIYRARKNKHGSLFTDVSELKQPQSSPCKGRMNDKGESFFYGGICELGTIYEMLPDIGSLFTISRITKQKQEDHPMFLIAGLLDDPRSPTPRNSTEKAIYNYLHGELTKVTSNVEEYNSTIAISRVLLSKGLSAPENYSLSGLVYPSVQQARGVANVRTFNIGMKGDAFDDKFQIKDAFVYCLTHEVEAYQLNGVNYGEIAGDGRINWKFDFAEMQHRMRSGLTSDGLVVESLKHLQI